MNTQTTIVARATDINGDETLLQKQVSFIEREADDFIVTTDDEYASAAEFVTGIKRQQKSVKAFFEPMRIKAKETYDAVLDRKNAMMKPLESAEKTIKSKMSDYKREKERQRRQQEEEMRRMAKLEAERKLSEAVAADAVGDAEAAEAAMAEADVMSGVAETGVVAVAAVKVKGVSTRKSWKITSVDKELVPVTVAGVEIRPVDEKAVLRLIKASKGQITIPGVKFEEVPVISVRS